MGDTLGRNGCAGSSVILFAAFRTNGIYSVHIARYPFTDAGALGTSHVIRIIAAQTHKHNDAAIPASVRGTQRYHKLAVQKIAVSVYKHVGTKNSRLEMHELPCTRINHCVHRVRRNAALVTRSFARNEQKRRQYGKYQLLATLHI